jgi:hypothetical protein
MLKKLSFVFLFITICCSAQDKIKTPHVSPALRFTENLGQWDQKILFRAQLDGGALFMEKDALLFNFYDKKKYRSLHHGSVTKGSSNIINFHSYRIRFENCNSAFTEKQEIGPDYENYFLSEDESKWRSGVKNYRRLWYRNLYNHIDYEIITAINGLKYNFHVAPAGDPYDIKLKYEGVDNLRLINGTLVYSLTVNNIVEQKPYAYQLIKGIIHEVKCDYILENNSLSFNFPKGYNLNYELIIDPVLVFAAQSGSTADNFGSTATWDAQQNLYAGGICFDVGYPTTVGAYSANFNGPATPGSTDVVITKYNSSGTALLFSTYLGGAGAEIVTSLIVDHQNNLCLLGVTGSTNFPTSSGAYDSSFNGGDSLRFTFTGTNFNNGTDIFVTKFNPSGTTLIASTYLGGIGNDGLNHVNHLTAIQIAPQTFVYEYFNDSLQFNYGDQYRGEIQIDVADNLYIASNTRSSNFPVSINAFDNSLGGKQDAILVKLNPTLSQLLYSTYLGGSNNDCANGLIINDNQEVYITGGTCSTNFPSTNGAYNTTYNGGKTDGYISHISTLSGALLQSTFIGTNNYDQSYFVQQDNASNIYIFGQSKGNMPVTGSVYNNPGRHQFICRLNNNLSSLNLGTVIGSNMTNPDISPSAFFVDGCGNIYFTGWGGDIITGPSISNMPLMNPTQSTTDGFDFYLMELSPGAGSILYGSYFGGAISQEHSEGGTSRIDKNGIFYQSVCAGCGGNDDFPVTSGAWPNTSGNPNHSSNCNNGVFKVDTQPIIAASNIIATYSGCLPFAANLNVGLPVSNSTYSWYLGGNTISQGTTASVSFSNIGTYTVSLVVTNSVSCNLKDSSSIVINVNPVYPTVSVSSSQSVICIGESATLTANGANSYSWNTGDVSNQIIVSPSVTTSYTVGGSNPNNCSSSNVITQSVDICNGLLENTTQIEKIEIYPNPSTGRFYIAGAMKFNKLDISLYSAMGQLLTNFSLDPEYNFIDLAGKQTGVYFLKIHSNGVFISSKKIALSPF